MKIGITERGDAGINLSWVNKVNQVDGMILITKNITKMFSLNVLDLHRKGYKIIVHCTCTGYGGTELEPGVPNYQQQLFALASLIHEGFPAENCVLRIDPIFPSEKGMSKLHKVLSYFGSLNTGVTRIRVSVVDEYNHVKQRYAKRGWTPLYQGFQADDTQLNLVIKNLAMYPQRYEICAENRMYQLSLDKYPYLFEVAGCISNKDLEIMDIPVLEMAVNPQNRTGCHCLSCKYELFEKRQPCPHRCVYCFWKG
jgi:DNA repair photolyase